jgi:ribosomal protein S27E
MEDFISSCNKLITDTEVYEQAATEVECFDCSRWWADHEDSKIILEILEKQVAMLKILGKE